MEAECLILARGKDLAQLLERPLRVEMTGRGIDSVARKQGSDLIHDLLTDLGQLDQQFEVREVGEADGLQLLELRSRDTDSEFERILLGLRDDSLSLLVMEDAFGLRTEVRFEQIQRNPTLDSSLFTFQPPESADVIGEIQR